MAEVHTIKKTENEVVLKIYKTSASGGVVQVEMDDPEVMLDSETFVQNQSLLTIREIFWGAKKDKQIDISRVNDAVANTVHGHYYLINSGSYNFDGFVDNTYANGAIRVTADGPFHCILKLGKQGYEKS
jgi:hypothetical protein